MRQARDGEEDGNEEEHAAAEHRRRRDLGGGRRPRACGCVSVPNEHEVPHTEENGRSFAKRSLWHAIFDTDGHEN